MTTRIAKFSSLTLNLLMGLATAALLFEVSFQSATAKPPKPSSTSMPSKPVLEQPTSNKTPVLKMGSKGQAVKELQSLLKTAGFYQGSVDGLFGQQTQGAVIKFQHTKRLEADGIVGTKTWAALHG